MPKAILDEGKIWSHLRICVFFFFALSVLLAESSLLILSAYMKHAVEMVIIFCRHLYNPFPMLRSPWVVLHMLWSLNLCCSGGSHLFP